MKQVWHIAHGFNAMVLTDHNNLRNSKDVQEVSAEFSSNFILIQGMDIRQNTYEHNWIKKIGFKHPSQSF